MNLNRRNFLFGSAAVAALAGKAKADLGLRELKPGEKRTVGLIGWGIQMRGALCGQFLAHKDKVQIVAVCDVNKLRREDGAKKVNAAYKKAGLPECCKAVADFRDVVYDPNIDMVCIATPDHWHAYIAVEAMKHGKDVYCEKPLTFNVDESRKVIAAQEKYGRVFQTGSMQRAWPEFRTAVMIVRNGFIGEVTDVEANYGRGGQKLGGPSHPIRFFDDPKNAAKENAPAPYIDWDMWLGPAKWRPYSDQLAPRGTRESYPMFWRFDDDFGTGYNGDWGAHHLDIAQWGLDMDKSGPYKIIRSDEPYSTDLFHGGRRQFGMRMLFKNKLGHDVELYHGPFGTWGTVFYGTDAVSKKDNRLDAAIKKLVAYFKLDKAPVQVYKTTSRSQVENFVQHVEDRQPTASPAETGGRSAILCQLCNMSYVYDTGFDWDPVANDFANGTGKGISLKRDFCRNGWEVVV